MNHKDKLLGQRETECERQTEREREREREQRLKRTTNPVLVRSNRQINIKTKHNQNWTTYKDQFVILLLDLKSFPSHTLEHRRQS